MMNRLKYRATVAIASFSMLVAVLGAPRKW